MSYLAWVGPSCSNGSEVGICVPNALDGYTMPIGPTLLLVSYTMPDASPMATVPGTCLWETNMMNQPDIIPTVPLYSSFQVISPSPPPVEPLSLSNFPADVPYCYAAYGSSDCSGEPYFIMGNECLDGDTLSVILVSGTAGGANCFQNMRPITRQRRSPARLIARVPTTCPVIAICPDQPAPTTPHRRASVIAGRVRRHRHHPRRQ